MLNLLLTRRALEDIKAIESYSKEQWGETVADRYLIKIENSLLRLRQNPGLLRSKKNISKHFSFYRIEEHFLVCTMIHDNIYLLTVKHGSMDLPSRLLELEPMLLTEAKTLHERAKKSLI